MPASEAEPGARGPRLLVSVRGGEEARQALKQGSTVGAIDKMEKAAKIDGDYAKPHYQAAQLYEIELEEYGEAFS